jgi:hypothetical protein
MSQFFKAWIGDRARGAVIGLIAGIIGLPLACVCIIAAIWLGNALYETGDWGPWLLLALFILGLGAMGVFTFAIVFWSFSRRGRWLDSVFAPLGLKGSAYMVSGRRCRGTLDGRQVDVRFTRGPMLTLYVSTPPQTRLGIGEKNALTSGFAGIAGKQALETGDPDYAGLCIYPNDEAWARTLLADPEAKAALLRLMNASEWALFHNVILEQGNWLLRLYRNKGLFRYAIAPAEARQWFDDLFTLARVGESLPAPQAITG